MKAITLIVLAISLALLAPAFQAQTVDEPRFVNRMLGDFSTPAIVPGRTGTFSFTVNNPDPINLTAAMENVALQVSIYHYATLEESIPVSGISNPPLIGGTGTSAMVDCGDIQPGGSFPVELSIHTVKGTPHGSYFSQSTYFVRFMLSFSYQGQGYAMASRGHFTDVQWGNLTAGAGEMNRTYLKELGYDGIIPDSAFSVRKPIPLWPFFLLVGLTVASGLMALSFHVLDNPGRYPRAEMRLLRLSGRLNMWKRGILERPGKGRRD